MDLQGKDQSLLTFRVGPVLCSAPSLPVSSIIPPPKLTHPPGTDPSTPGIFKHGRHVVKVIDLREKFGVDEKDKSSPGNLVICIFEEEAYAFWVDQIIDVIDFPSSGWGNLPTAIPRGIFSKTLLLDNKIHLYAEFERLVNIPSLGYLKSYIQQLLAEENRQSEKVKSETAKRTQKPVTEIKSADNAATKTEPVVDKPRPARPLEKQAIPATETKSFAPPPITQPGASFYTS